MSMMMMMMHHKHWNNTIKKLLSLKYEMYQCAWGKQSSCATLCGDRGHAPTKKTDPPLSVKLHPSWEQSIIGKVCSKSSLKADFYNEFLLSETELETTEL